MRVPGGSLSTRLDRALVFCVADQIDGEVADDGHVLGAVAFAQAGEVLLEGYVERPMQVVLDCPMAAHRLGKGFCRERARGDVGASSGRDLAFVFALPWWAGCCAPFRSPETPPCLLAGLPNAINATRARSDRVYPVQQTPRPCRDHGGTF